jgi:hypothetical protein
MLMGRYGGSLPRAQTAVTCAREQGLAAEEAYALTAVGVDNAFLGDPDRAVLRFFEDPRTADVILFATTSNGRAALEAFNRFGQESSLREIPAVLLLDQNHAHWAVEAQSGEHRAVAKMPIKMRDLRGALVEAMQKKVS